MTNGLNTTASFTYSTLGLIAQTNQMTNWTCYLYDVAGRKLAETNANGEVTQFKYDAAGNLTNLIDAKGNNTWWKYDQYGRVTNKSDAAGNVIFTYAYDANGRLTNRWSPAKGNTRYAYDAAGNLTTIDYPNSPDVTLQYDANHRSASLSHFSAFCLEYFSGLRLSRANPISRNPALCGDDVLVTPPEMPARRRLV